MKVKKLPKRDVFPEKLRKLIEAILVTNEDIRYTLRESFNWDFVRTWAVVTSYRLLIVDVWPWRIDVQDFHLKDMNFEYKEDGIGPYDVLLFKSKLQDLYDLAILRNRRREAQEFLHNVSTEVRLQDTYGLRSLEAQSTNPSTDKKMLLWCGQNLEVLKRTGAISEKEYLEEKAKGDRCELN